MKEEKKMFNKEKLKAYLDENDLTCKAFGEMVGVSDAMVCYIVRGFKQPSASLLKRIADATGYSMDELMVEG